MNLNELPGAEFILPGLDDLHQGETHTVGALLIAIAAKQLLNPTQRKIQLMLAAIAAITDYQSDSELLVFSALDGEDFLQDSDENVKTIETDA